MDAPRRTQRADAHRTGSAPVAAPRVAPEAAAAPRAPAIRPWMAALAGLAAGALGAYLIASAQFSEQVAAIRQASELRVTAANQRIQELQDQQHQFAQQMDQKTQEIVADADAQQRQIVHQLSEKERKLLDEEGAKERALLAQESAKERALLAQQQALLEQEKARERDLAKPDLPVKVWVHKPLAGPGLVAQVHNFGNADLALSVTSRGAGAAAQGTWHGVVAPNANQAIGKESGWILIPGDQLDLTADGFRPMIFVVAANARAPQKPAR
jgi:hypothetical protein